MEHIEYLLAHVGDLPIALPLDLVMAVSEDAPITPLPFCPRHVAGLVYVLDRVMPLVELSQVLERALSPRASLSSSLVVVANGDDVRALRVDVVTAMTAIETATISPLSPEDQAHPLLTQGFEHAGIVWSILDYLRFVAETGMDPDGLVEDAALVSLEPVGLDEALLAPPPEPVATMPYLQIALGAERYCVATSDIGEIVTLTDLRRMPGAPAYVLGLTNRHDRPLLVLDTGALLGLAPGMLTAGTALVVKVDGLAAPVALLVDKALGILRVADDQVFAINESMAGVASYTVVEDRILGILSPNGLVAAILGALLRIAPEAEAIAEPDRPAASERHEISTAAQHAFLTLRIGENYYCMDLERVDRILSSVRLSPLPGGGNGFDGMADTGDQAVPVRDLRRVFNPNPTEPAPPCILLQLEGSTAGLAIDQVLRIENVPADDLSDVADNAELPIHAVARVGERLMAVLTIDRLLPRLAL